MRSLYTRRHRLHCFRTNEQCRNGQPTDGANTVVYIAGWHCGTGAGGGGCSRGPHNAIAGEFVETSAEKHTRTEREAAENRKTVLECENNPELVLMQEGASGHYIYECLSEQTLVSECSRGVCRQPMYEEYEGRAIWTERVAEACHAVNGAMVANETREHNGVVEYECEVGESRAWVSLPYVPPTVYAEIDTT